MTVCTCPPDGFADTACRRHGLYGRVAFSPMDRHARPPEPAADAQKRLYLASAADRVRVQAAGFPWPLRAVPPREMGQR